MTVKIQNSNSQTFVKITNKDIYNEIQNLKSLQQKNHEELSLKVNTTNGKVKKSLWIATTAMTLIIILIGLFFNHVAR